MKMLGFREGVGVCGGLGFYHGLLSTTLPTWVKSLQALPHQMTSHFGITIDTEIKAKRNNMISELITF